MRRAALLVALQGALLVAGGLAYAVAGLLGDPSDRLGAAVGALLIAGLGALVLLVARALDRTRRWARSPAVVVQLFSLPVGFQLTQTRFWPAGAVALVLAVAVLLQLAAPDARVAFEDPGRS